MKTILYLDQNYVSYLTKARLGVKVYADVAAYYENLYDALREAVQANALVCPASQFHYSESELDTRLAPDIYRTLEELYCGVEFHGFTYMIQAQTVAALCHYLGVSREQELDWTQAFKKDPHSPFDATAQPMRHTVSQDLAASARAMKAVHVTPRETAPAGTFQEHKRSEAQQFIFYAYLQPYLNFARGDTDIVTVGGLNFMDDLFLAYSDLIGRPPTAEEIVAFLQSEQMMVAPFVDVYSSISAAMALDRERKPKGSDLPDVLIAATVLPYCDVFATDGHMKHLIVALKLDKRYNVAAFGSRKADVLALTTLVRALPCPDTP